MEKYLVIGLMSGTSLDGLDIALCEFYKSHAKWNYKILKAQTVNYSKELIAKIQNAPNLTGEELFKLHNEFGRFSGQSVLDFLEKTNSNILLIASHWTHHFSSTIKFIYMPNRKWGRNCCNYGN